MTRAFKPYLPGVLSLVAAEIGVDSAIALARARGGRSLWIPKQPEARHAVARIVGLENARILSNLLGSGYVIIPCGNFGGMAGRRQRIAQLLQEGMPQEQIAAEVDVHIRTVERVSVELSRGSGRQLSLFPDLETPHPDTCRGAKARR